MKVLLDTIIKEQELKNDAAVARLLNLPHPAISKIRTGKLTLGATLTLRIYDKTGMSIERIRELAAQV